jgi:glutaredoxin 3
MSKVRVFVTSYCPYCTRAKQFLKSHDIDFETVDVTTDAEKRDWLVETTGMRTVPQIFVGDESVGGYTDMQALHRGGDFFPLLESEGVSYSE